MTYLLEVYPEAQAEIEGLPPAGLSALIEVFALLDLTPWAGDSVNELRNPDAPLRSLAFGGGSGIVTYLILEREREVHVVSLVWAG
ncbi:hypothetical protein [Pseudonocardia sp. N23]|uniref:hypothetical protein n=1 Tax=Pseudonocardia sp. N23 TaxID=1987376 RepID=UPI000BFE2F81|nr:hypothetical protein [Pseudonocardia sp. N23]RTL65355.1 MAG: hypothetical protein EKK42_21385 [Pseudonocardiaceae bacterium]GAY10647.1 hypothetical protein TOK_5008 [Pseudonocardia sp. N23]